MPTYVGNDGRFTGSIGAVINSWQATISAVSHDVTGFVHSGRARKLGVVDITGTASGFQQSDSAAPWSLLTNATGATVTLYTLYHTTTSSASSINFNAVIAEIPLGSVKTGDASVSFNFQLSVANTNTTIYTAVWQSS